MITEMMQPTIFATSSTYIAYTLSTYINLLPIAPSETQFSYYCCILGLISVLVFYMRFALDESHRSKVKILYIVLLVLLIVLYAMHWFKEPGFHKMVKDPDTFIDYHFDKINKLDNEQNYTQYAKLLLEKCVDKRKCSHPLHLVLQVAFMICVLTSLIASLFS